MAKVSFIKSEIDWLETKITELRQYVDNNPFHTLEDRTEIVMSAKGTPVIKIIATKEAQLKELRAILKELPSMFADLDKLREARAAAEIEVRGGGEINGMMRSKLSQDD